MPSFIPVPQGVQLCFDLIIASQACQFCLMLRKSAGSVTPTDLADVTTAAESWWTSTYKTLTGNNTQLAQVRATDMSVQGGAQDIEAVGEVGTGGGSTGWPNNVAIRISQRTAKRGRSYRGGPFTVGYPTANIASQTDISSGFAASLATAFAVLQSDLDALGFDVVIATKQHNNVTVNPAETNEVIANVVDTHFDSQRRRLFGRGT